MAQLLLLYLTGACLWGWPQRVATEFVLYALLLFLRTFHVSMSHKLCIKITLIKPKYLMEIKQRLIYIFHKIIITIYFILPLPVDSIRDAILTVSPKRQYLGIVVPTTPATQGPVKNT